MVFIGLNPLTKFLWITLTVTRLSYGSTLEVQRAFSGSIQVSTLHGGDGSDKGTRDMFLQDSRLKLFPLPFGGNEMFEKAK